jgi:hypothetical protein
MRWLLRHYFAAKAMHAFLVGTLPEMPPEKYKGMSVGQYVAARSYQMADAMLAAGGER